MARRSRFTMKLLSILFAVSVAGFASATQELFSSAAISDPIGGVVAYNIDNSLTIKTKSLAYLTGTAMAKADYGSLHAYSTAVNNGGTYYSYAQGYARFRDMITITGGVGTGQFFTDFTVEGTHQSTGVAYSIAQIYWNNLPNGVPGTIPAGVHTYAGTVPINFTYGVPFELKAEFYSQVLFLSGGIGSGTTDFLNTATLSATHIYDNFGHQLNGMTISAGSGHIYPAAVPEPATFAALGLGLVALVRRRNRC